MSLFGSILGKVAGGIFSGSGSSKAARAQAEAAQAALDEGARQFDTARADLAPFVAPGADALSALQQGSSVGGLDARLAEIINSDSFGALRGQRLQSLNSSQGQRGLLRSGAGLEEIAALDTDLALALENQLFGRQSGLASNAQAAAAGQAGNAIQAGQTSANLLLQQGNANAAGIVGRTNAITDTIGGIGELLAKQYGEQ